MSLPRYEPSPLARVEVRAGERRALVFVRELPHPPEVVWSALTEPRELAEWAPFDADHSLAVPGTVVLTMAGVGGGQELPGTVRRAERPGALEYTWGEDVLCWELEASDAGSRLTLLHTLEDPSFIAPVAAGWHLCIDVMDRFLAGDPVGRIVAEDAKKHGWEKLKDEYAAALGR